MFRLADTAVHLRLQTEKDLGEYKQQSKLIFRKLNEKSEPACSIESGNYILQCVAYFSSWFVSANVRNSFGLFSYLIVNQVVYLTISEKSYPRKLAFSYLDELSKEFERNYGSQIASATRPYTFRGFGECHTTLLR